MDIEIWLVDIKFVFVILAFAFGIPSFGVYLLHMLKGPVQPHPFTWFIWLTTQVVATIGIWVGGGGYGVAYYVFYCFTIFTILVVTLIKFGLKEVNNEDWICLGICLVAVIIWIGFDSPITAVLIVTGVDAFGFFPTFRKSYFKPWSESLWGWGLSIPNIIFTALAMDQYNWLTLSYPVVMGILTFILITICLVRRISIPEPVNLSEQ